MITTVNFSLKIIMFFNHFLVPCTMSLKRQEHNRDISVSTISHLVRASTAGITPINSTRVRIKPVVEFLLCKKTTT